MKHTSVRLDPETKCLLEKLAERLGIKQASLIRMLIRKEAKKEGISCDKR